MNEKYLPIGTVVLLKGAIRRLMITGFCINTKDNPDEIYDYLGCLYPQGVLTSEQNLVFNHEQIEKIYFMGYIDEEEKEFKDLLKKQIANMNTEVLNIEKAETSAEGDNAGIELPKLI